MQTAVAENSNVAAPKPKEILQQGLSKSFAKVLKFPNRKDETFARYAYLDALKTRSFTDPSVKLTADQKTEYKTLRKTLLKTAKLTRIEPSLKHAHLHQQLLGEDQVHDLNDLDTLYNKRLGGKNDSKQTFALVANGHVLSVIYVSLSEVPLVSGKVLPKDLPDNVSVILNADSQYIKNPNLATFYSISTIVGGFGAELIKAIYQEFSDIHKTTLSPFRTFAKWLETNHPGETALSKEEHQEYALTHLLENTNVVQKFHLGNGAYIAGANFDACDDKTWDSDLGVRVMFNYFYHADSEKIARHAKFYTNDQKLFMSQDVLDLAEEFKLPTSNLVLVK